MTPATPLHIHLIAICGTAMGALAILLKNQGHHVTGSDRDVYPPMSETLASHAIPVYQGFDAGHLDPAPDLVVIGNAVSRGNPEAEATLERKIRYMSMPEALKAFFLWDRRSIVITGTHGKTTVTTLLTWILRQNGFDPSYIIGGVPVGWDSGAHTGKGPYIVLEGDEYDSAFFDKRAKFLHYLPEIVIINNIEFDHADIYQNVDEIALAFRRLINIIPRNGLLVGAGDDERVRALAQDAFCPVALFGDHPDAQWTARRISVSGSGTAFDVWCEGRLYTRLDMPLYGVHNVHNALSVVAVADHIGVSPDDLARTFRSFPGVRRRLETRGVVNGITVYDDFAHHPTAVKVTLAALKTAFPQSRLWAVYEPRSATSIRAVFQDAFLSAFDAADRIILAPAFNPGKAPEGNRFSVEELVAGLRTRGKDALTLPDVETIVAWLVDHAEPGDRIVFMSNGGFGGIHTRCLEALRARS